MELKQLISECAKGSTTAQRYLFDKFSTRFLLLCNRYLKQDEDAEDAMMNGFLQIFQSLSKFRFENDAACISWMKKIMVNKCLEIIRSKHRFLSVVDESKAEDIAIDETLYQQLEVKAILACIEKLPIGYRTVFNLYVIESYSHKEIAALLNIREGTSKSQLNRAKQYLQNLILEQDKFIQHATK
ncbi:RNA polymerase sigma factor [Sediminibacterium sp.]|jgi:RNA polymerase sigma factor (sigma-70 family)|uniref:RNA polymerase sigma factor n=1 Tax=Sediminibacterium sp. TaxID=1917865 RepID=UPI000CBE7DE1|nr:sigma-70 family RNA polymerase sigma factor [Sediminibacterium sp.]MBA4260280.1 RNA polymerase subunit sigma-24 [Chitinophaga sp.]MDP2420816.1 sigma-70 family RNA polymerase sigma factor [Sediminibacterium sp.]PJE46442.1 MAG: RNA polymerase subunit sigma-24 [Sediminibacterium sp.] [Sediminibacterium sp. FEMGT703S]HPH36137.1 sigma-70 family RNA polymerase sigma factor [Sediminibacterium sp.]